jgi:hypothetical protein
MSSASNEHAHDQHGASEPDKPNNGFIAVLIAVICVSIVAVCVGVQQFFAVTIRKEISTKVLEQGGEELRLLRASEADKLSRYQWVKKADAVVRIPVQRAQELTLAEWNARPAGLWPIGGLDTAAPTPAPAPSAATSSSAAPATSASAAAPATSGSTAPKPAPSSSAHP